MRYIDGLLGTSGDDRHLRRPEKDRCTQYNKWSAGTLEWGGALRWPHVPVKEFRMYRECCAARLPSGDCMTASHLRCTSYRLKSSVPVVLSEPSRQKRILPQRSSSRVASWRQFSNQIFEIGGQFAIE